MTNENEQTIDEPIYVVACSSSLKPDERAEAVAMPWSPSGQAASGFRKPTWAIPAWMMKVRPSDLGPGHGWHIPKTKMAEIIKRLPPDPIHDLTPPESGDDPSLR